MNYITATVNQCNRDNIFALILPHVLFCLPIYLSHNECSGLPVNQTGSITELNKVFKCVAYWTYLSVTNSLSSTDIVF